MRHTSVDVPPMSKLTASAQPFAACHSGRGSHARRGPGQQQRRRAIGRLRERHEPAGRRHHQHDRREAGEPTQVGATRRLHVRVDDGGDEALVLAVLGRDLVRRHHVDAALRELLRGVLFVLGPAISVKEAHRHGLDAIRDARTRPTSSLTSSVPSAAIRPGIVSRSARVTSGSGRSAHWS